MLFLGCFFGWQYNGIYNIRRAINRKLDAKVMFILYAACYKVF